VRPRRLARPIWVAAGGALIVSTLATSCFKSTRVALTPSPDPSRITVQGRALAALDTIARSHGLNANPTLSKHKCFVRRREAGLTQGHWGDGSLQMYVCAEVSDPYRLEIDVLQDGFRWNDRGRKLRDELLATLRARFGTESVVVEWD
jgi:hypothetical protein